MKIFNFFISNFRDIFHFFKFPSKFQNHFPKFFRFLWPIFSKLKTKIFNSKFTNDFFQTFSFQIFLMT
jgi:hypothetical protein